MTTLLAKNHTGRSFVHAIQCLATILLLLLTGLPAVAQDLVTFFGETSGSSADYVLKNYLQGEVRDLDIEYDPSDYEFVIDRLVTAKDKPYLARTTPYVFVVAEMLGAKMDILAFYKSKTTGTTTYNTYFVVNRKDFSDLDHAPTLKDLTDSLRRMGSGSSPATFIYHSTFSTSSYFLPSLFLKNQDVYSMKQSTESVLIPIESRKLTDEEMAEKGKPGSTDLALTVAQNEGFFAAVWDGTKAKFEPGGTYHKEYGSSVFFIKLETILPNDLLVSASSLDIELKNRISTAIANMNHEHLSNAFKEGNLGDVLFWINKNADGDHGTEIRTAQRALNHLRSLARTRIRPAIINIQVKKETGLSEKHTEAARHAVRLSGTELILKEKVSQESKTDITWTLEAIHDEAISLTSQIERHPERTTQRFRISYKKGNMKDLTKRLGDIIQSRMHRIRYIWPYKNLPTVIRDISFPIDKEVSVEKLTWIDPDINKYSVSSSFSAEAIRVDDLFKFQLKDFDEGHKDFNDPLNNVSYRVVLKRPTQENTTLTVLTGMYVVLLVLSAVGAVYGYKRHAYTTVKG